MIKLVIECETSEQFWEAVDQLRPGPSKDPVVVTTASPCDAEKPEPVEREPDERGYFWDERIHSSSRKKTSKGFWKIKRGANATYIKQIEAEQLSEVSSSPSPLRPPPPPPPPVEIEVEPIDFPGLMNYMAQNNVTLDEANILAKGAGLASVAHLTAEPDKIPEVYAAMQTHVNE